MNLLLPWSITSTATKRSSRGRRPLTTATSPYVTAVDRASETGALVAIVGIIGYTYGLERLVPDPGAIVDIDGKHQSTSLRIESCSTGRGFRLVR